MKDRKGGNFTLFKGKRGMSHELFFNVFELVLVSIVILSLFYFINDVSNKTIFEKNYMARDLALLLNTIYSAPGEVVYNYNQKPTGFAFDFSGNKVEVRQNQDKESIKASYPFAKNNNIAFQDNTLNYEKENVKIKIFKSEEFMGVSKPETQNPFLAFSQQSSSKS